jgi:hypothetical protein
MPVRHHRMSAGSKALLLIVSATRILLLTHPQMLVLPCQDMDLHPLVRIVHRPKATIPVNTRLSKNRTTTAILQSLVRILLQIAVVQVRLQVQAQAPVQRCGNIQKPHTDVLRLQRHGRMNPVRPKLQKGELRTVR